MKYKLLREVMVTKVISICEDEPFSHVEEKLRLNKIRHLPVVDELNQLVGIITQRDLYRAVSPRETESGFSYDAAELDEYVLKHFMTQNPLTLKADHTVYDAVNIFVTRKYGCIPIVDDKRKLVGIVTQMDILKFIAKQMQLEG